MSAEGENHSVCYPNKNVYTDGHICWTVNLYRSMLSLTTLNLICPSSWDSHVTKIHIFSPYPRSLLILVQLTVLNPGHFLSVEILVYLDISQAILIDLADVFAGRSSLRSHGYELELLIKTFLHYCVLSLKIQVINAFKTLTKVSTLLLTLLPFCLP